MKFVVEYVVVNYEWPIPAAAFRERSSKIFHHCRHHRAEKREKNTKIVTPFKSKLNDKNVLGQFSAKLGCFSLGAIKAKRTNLCLTKIAAQLNQQTILVAL